MLTNSEHTARTRQRSVSEINAGGRAYKNASSIVRSGVVPLVLVLFVVLLVTLAFTGGQAYRTNLLTSAGVIAALFFLRLILGPSPRE